MLPPNERVLQAALPALPKDLDRPKEKILDDPFAAQFRTPAFRSHLFQDERRYSARIPQHIDGSCALT